MQFRESLGLAADATLVGQTFSDPTYSDDSFGIPMTKAEAASVRAEVDAQDALLKTVTAATKLPGFVGAYFTHDQLTLSVSSQVTEDRVGRSRVRASQGGCADQPRALRARRP